MFTSQAEADAKNAANKEKAEAAKAKAESSFAAAQAAEKLAADAGYKDASLNTAAEAAIQDWTKAKSDASKLPPSQARNLLHHPALLMVAFACSSASASSSWARTCPSSSSASWACSSSW